MSAVAVVALLLLGSAPAVADPSPDTVAAAVEGGPSGLLSSTAGDTLPVLPERSTAVVPTTAAIAGTVVFEDAPPEEMNEETGLPTNQDVEVEVWSSDRHLVQIESLESADFRIDGLSAGESYFLALHVYSDEWSSLWYGGSAVAVGAVPLVAPAGDVVLTTTRSVVFQGTVRGLDDIWSVRAVYRDPTTRRLVTLASDQVSPAADGVGEFVFWSMPAGTYTVLAGAAAGGHDDRFWREAPRVDAADFFDVGVDEARPIIDIAIDEDEPWTWHSARLSGTDRYGTAVAVSRSAFAPGVPVLYVASGANWPDALSAGPAAAVQGGALLLTDPDRLPDVVANEIRRLRPARVVVAGSELSVSRATFEEIARIVPQTERIGGRDRYETSRMLSAGLFDSGRWNRELTVFLATGRNFPDALSASSAAAQQGSPVILVDGAGTRVDGPTSDAIADARPTWISVIGGPATITPELEASLHERFWSQTIERIAGKDRYETSAMLFRQSEIQDTAFLAAGANFPDALAGVAAGAAQGSAVLLVERDCIHQQGLDVLKGQSKNYVTLLGSPLTLTSDVADLRACSF